MKEDLDRAMRHQGWMQKLRPGSLAALAVYMLLMYLVMSQLPRMLLAMASGLAACLVSNLAITLAEAKRKSAVMALLDQTITDFNQRSKDISYSP